MPDLDHLPPAPLVTDDKPAKPFRISRKLDRALDAMITGEAKTVKAAAELAGMARETLSRHLARPEVQAETERRVKRLMGGPTLARAHGVLSALLDAESEHVRFKAAELILAVNGIRPPPAGVNLQINNNVTPGWVIDLRPPPGHVLDEHGNEVPIIDVIPNPIEGHEP